MQPWLAELLSPELIPTAEGLLRHGAAAHADHPETLRAAAARRTMAAAEVAAGLVVSHITGGNHLGRATVLVQDLPNTLAMLERGALDMYRAKMIAERALRLDNPDLIPAFEQRALALVPGRSPGQLEKLLDRIIIDLHPRPNPTPRTAPTPPGRPAAPTSNTPCPASTPTSPPKPPS
ncbi:DUF222 domain-containing protein [Nakamurella sp. YIM 132087]|uniref:DUF222 domain-containing protein n=2 Tax=Nakamurella alba TaxID=2665158 RepID=A0A7K1FL45_9ACTN|nr:DUF222 domain-containing protein [Nakamurella alba]